MIFDRSGGADFFRQVSQSIKNNVPDFIFYPSSNNAIIQFQFNHDLNF